MSQSDREKTLSALYAKALKEVRRRHEEEFHQILTDLYKDTGIEVRQRLTGERKRKAEIEKAKALLASLESSTQ